MNSPDVAIVALGAIAAVMIIRSKKAKYSSLKRDSDIFVAKDDNKNILICAIVCNKTLTSTANHAVGVLFILINLQTYH